MRAYVRSSILRRCLICLAWLLLVAPSEAVWFTNSFSADAFVRAAAPTLNYGGAGALSVSGSNAVNGIGTTNGAFDSFIRLNGAAMVSNFNLAFGTSNWHINAAKLSLTELGAPANTLFNRGTGSFEIRWIANDTWLEGTGTPNAPTMDGIDYNNEPTLLNSNTDLSLGTFTNAGVDGPLIFWLALPDAFLTNLCAGGDVGLFLTATDERVGFTFDSRSFQTTSARPALEVSAVSIPGISTLSITGTGVVLSCTNGSAGTTCSVLSASNLAAAADQWVPMGAQFLTNNGDFVITLTNAFDQAGGAARFFTLRSR